jgi:hypothetical protein
MGSLSEDTQRPAHPAVERASETAIRAILNDEEERYPPGTAFVSLDMPDAREVFERLVREETPIALVLPDGRDIVLIPKLDALTRLRRRLGLARDRGGFPVLDHDDLELRPPPGFHVRVHIDRDLVQRGEVGALRG